MRNLGLSSTTKCELAKEYEERAVLHGEQFYWCQNESLAELEQPDRVAAIKANWETSESRRRGKRWNLRLVETVGGLEEADPAHL